MSSRYFELPKGGECIVEIPHDARFSFTHKRKRVAHTYSSHAAAIAAYQAKLQALIEEDSVELTPWFTFASHARRYHVRIPTSRRFTRIDLHTERRTTRTYDTVRQALNAYNAWMRKQHAQGLRHVPCTWQEFARHPGPPWVEHTTDRHYFAHEDDPSHEFGPEMHLRTDGRVKSAMFQVDSTLDHFRIQYDEDGTWTHLSLRMTGLAQGASLILNPDATISQLSYQSACEGRTTALWLMSESSGKINEWTHNGLDADQHKHGIWWLFNDSGYMIKLTYLHGQLTHKSAYRPTSHTLSEEVLYLDDGSISITHYADDGETVEVQGTQNVRRQWLYKDTFHEKDGSLWLSETYTYDASAHMTSKTIVSESSKSPGSWIHTEFTYDSTGAKIATARHTHPAMTLLARWHVTPDECTHYEIFHDDGLTLYKCYTEDRDDTLTGTFDVFDAQGQRAKRFTFHDMDPHANAKRAAPRFIFISSTTPHAVTLDVPGTQDECSKLIAQVESLYARSYSLKGPWVELKHHSHTHRVKLRVPMAPGLERVHIHGDTLKPQRAQAFESLHLTRLAYNTELSDLLDQGWQHVTPDVPFTWPYQGPEFALLDYTPHDDQELTQRTGYIAIDDLSKETFHGPYRERYHDSNIVDAVHLHGVQIGWKVGYSEHGVITLAQETLRNENNGWFVNFDERGLIKVAGRYERGDKRDVWQAGGGDSLTFEARPVQDPAHPTWATHVTYFHADDITPHKRGHRDAHRKAQGAWEFFDESGKLKSITDFKHGDPTSFLYMDHEGVPHQEKIPHAIYVTTHERSALGALERKGGRPSRPSDTEHIRVTHPCLKLWFTPDSKRLEVGGFIDEDTLYHYTKHVYGPATHHTALGFDEAFGLARELCQVDACTRARWLELCALVERMYALHGTQFVEELLPYIITQTRSWPTSHRMAPWLWINKFITHALPVEALHMISSLSLSAAMNAPYYHNERTPLLIAWLGSLPENTPSLDGLHISFRHGVIHALEHANAREPDPRFHAKTSVEPMVRWNHGTLDDILQSKIAARLRVLDMSHSLPLWDYHTNFKGATVGRSADLCRISHALQSPDHIEVLDLAGSDFAERVTCVTLPHLKALNVGLANPLGTPQLNALSRATPALEALHIVPHCIGWLLGEPLPEEDEDYADNIGRYWSIYDSDWNAGRYEIQESALHGLLAGHPGLKHLVIQRYYAQSPVLTQAHRTHPELHITDYPAHLELVEEFASDWALHFDVNG